MKNKIFLSPPHMCGKEVEFVKEAFKSNYIAPNGPMVDDFEREFAIKTGFPYSVAVSSGTAAMHLVMYILRVRPGDEVISSSLTFIGSVSPVLFLGGVPIFIDSDKESWNLDIDLLADVMEKCAKSGKLPKAVVSTDIYGQCSNLAGLLEICNRYDTPLVIDAAESLGSKYNGIDRTNSRKGLKAVIYSFNGNKIITTSGGGMIASDDKNLIEYARKLSSQAREPFPHFEHNEVGYNCRMSNILAAIGLGQLKILDERVEMKRKIYKYYYEALKDIPGIDFMPEAPFGRSNKWLTVILISPDQFGVNKEVVREALENEGIESRPVWKPMHLQPIFKVGEKKAKKLYRSRIIGGKIAEDLFERGLCLPSGTALTEKDLDRIISIILRIRKK